MTRTCSVVLAAVTASLLGPGAAHAGSYQVVSCNAPGANGVNRAWVGGPNAFNQAPEPQNYDVYDDSSAASCSARAAARATTASRPPP